MLARMTGFATGLGIMHLRWKCNGVDRNSSELPHCATGMLMARLQGKFGAQVHSHFSQSQRQDIWYGCILLPYTYRSSCDYQVPFDKPIEALRMVNLWLHAEAFD